MDLTTLVSHQEHQVPLFTLVDLANFSLPLWSGWEGGGFYKKAEHGSFYISVALELSSLSDTSLELV